MNKTTLPVSLHNRLIRSIMALAVVVILTASIAIVYLVDRQGTAIIADETRAWANSLARSSSQLIEADNGQIRLKKELERLVSTQLINHIHIYRVYEDENIDYFTSYNKNHNFPPISDRISEISKLSNVTVHPDYLELIVRILDDKRTIGYLYIQTSLVEKQTFIQRIIYVLLAFLLFSLIVSFSVARSLFNRINHPLETLIDELSGVSQKRSYHQPLSHLPFKELDYLTININVLLVRVKKQINSLQDEHQHTKIKNQALEDKLSARTNALKESNQELLSTLEKLHEYQGQLVETEKMASLGDLVAGIAHEVNTPIGLGVTASSLLADKLNEIKKAFEDRTLKSSQLKKFLTDGEENVAIIFRNLERAAELISSFKKVAVDQSSADNRIFNVNGLMDEVLLTLSTKLEPSHVKVKVHCPDDLIINSKPGPLNQILINLIMNSIYHAFDDRKGGNITINIMNLSDQLHINYSDDGVGIDDSMKSKIFEPFTTTKRGSGGSGLGMHLVYNLVTQALDGHITLVDEPKSGVSFDITFPVEVTTS